MLVGLAVLRLWRGVFVVDPGVLGEWSAVGDADSV